jgi:hypothetical protein
VDDNDAEKWLSTFIEDYMFGDIDRVISLDRSVSFLIALSLSTYTEVLGGLVMGKIAKGNPSYVNYKTFLMRMCYSEYECKRYYGKVRCGLVHQYVVKHNSTIGMYLGNTRGIEERNDHVYFDVKLYYDELKKAYSDYKNQLSSDLGLRAKLRQAISDESVPTHSELQNVILNGIEFVGGTVSIHPEFPLSSGD